jgi:hypothetical protein
VLDQPVDFEQACMLLHALGATPQDLPDSPTFEDLLYARVVKPGLFRRLFGR